MDPMTFKASRLGDARNRSMEGRSLARRAEGTVVLPRGRLELGLAESDPAHRAEVLVCGLDREHVRILGRKLKSSRHDYPSFALSDRGERLIAQSHRSLAYAESRACFRVYQGGRFPLPTAAPHVTVN